MKILLTNIYNLNNLGTQADLQVLQRFFKGSFYVYSFPIFLNKNFLERNRITVLSKEPKNFFSLLINFIENILMAFSKKKFFQQIDVAIDLAGDTLNDTNYTIFHPLIYFLNLLPALIHKIPIIIFSQSIGPIKLKLNIYLAKIILKRTRFIIVRESFSYDFLMKTLGINKNNVFLLPPVSFILFSPNKKVHKKNYAALFVDKNLYYIMGKFESLLLYKQIIDILLKKFEKVFILGSVLGPSNLPFPLKKIGDTEVINELKKENKNKKIIFSSVKNLADLNDILEKCSISVCSKFHPLVFSLGLGMTPLVISYHKKTEHLMRDLKLTNNLLKIKQNSFRNP